MEIHTFLWNAHKSNYRTILILRTKLQMYLEVFIGTEDEGNIIAFMSHRDEKEHEKFNDLCQVIMTEVFLSFEKTFKGIGKVQFWNRIYLFFTNDVMQKKITTLTKIPGKKNCFLGVIIFCICELFENIMTEFKEIIVEETSQKAKMKAIKHSQIMILYTMLLLLLDMQ